MIPRRGTVWYDALAPYLNMKSRIFLILNCHKSYENLHVNLLEDSGKICVWVGSEKTWELLWKTIK